MKAIGLNTKEVKPMEPSYWQKYDLVFKRFSFRGIYKEILGFTKKLGEPFTKKSKRGRKFKVNPKEYVAYIIFEMISYNCPFRDMELGSELYLNKHIDHSTFGKNFQKVPYEYFIKLLSMTSKLLERLLGEVKLLIVDSTGIHTKIYYDCLFEGKETKRKKRLKVHALISSHKKEHITYVRAGLATDLHVSDAGGASIMLKTQNNTALLLADRGYDDETLYTTCKQKGIVPNIKPKICKSTRSPNRKRAIKNYNLDLYKKGRGVVETIFGGLRNKGLLSTRLRKEENIYKQGIICLFRHNLFTLLRIKAGAKFLSYLINRQTLLKKWIWIFMK